MFSGADNLHALQHSAGRVKWGLKGPGVLAQVLQLVEHLAACALELWLCQCEGTMLELPACAPCSHASRKMCHQSPSLSCMQNPSMGPQCLSVLHAAGAAEGQV